MHGTGPDPKKKGLASREALCLAAHADSVGTRAAGVQSLAEFFCMKLSKRASVKRNHMLLSLRNLA